MSTELNHNELYRLPWTLPDNAITWLEPTSKCNLYCDGCYRKNESDGHKSFEAIRAELEIFHKLRKTDCVSIAGGDPLTHPDLEAIVALIARNGQKPIINTNGLLLTREKLKALKKAGATGFTFHIDSGQHRPGMNDKTEIELNELRHKYARMLAEEGDICCGFNATVYPHTLKFVPDIIEWGQKNIDIVNTIVFIAFRAAPLNKGYDFYVGGKKIDIGNIAYASGGPGEPDIMSRDIIGVIRERWPDFAPCSYLNGTERPDHLKWLLTVRIGTNDRIYGYAGPKFMELSQTLYHFKNGSYLSYATPKTMGRARAMLLLSPLDCGLRGTIEAYIKHAIQKPAILLKKLRLQSIMIIQPADMMHSGAMSMCDGCPDMTAFEDRLVWSCRLEELNNFGDWIRPVPADNIERPVKVVEKDMRGRPQSDLTYGLFD